MKVFVTGASGFVGLKLVAWLKRQDRMVKILSRPHRSQIFEYETVICDLQKDSLSGGVLDGIETVFHLVGLTHTMNQL